MIDKQIKFYGINDLATYRYIDDVTNFIKDFNYDKKYNLSEIINIFNVVKYVNCSEICLQISIEEKIKFKEYVPQLIGKDLICEELNEIGEEYNSLGAKNIQDFWELFCDYGWINKIKISNFESFVKKNNVHIYYLISQKKISEKYKMIIKKMLLSRPQNFELFLNSIDSFSTKKLYFPTVINNEEINEWARRYCELENANPNYLKQLSNWSDKHEYKINEIVLLNAKKKYRNNVEKLVNLKTGITSTMSIQFKNNLKNNIEVDDTSTPSNFKLIIDSDWIDENLDYPTLLNNFKYIFNFFSDFQQFISIESGYRSDGLLDILQGETKYQYKTTLAFNIKRRMYNLIFNAYFSYLEFKRIDMEEVFGYCYNNLFSEELHNENFFFNISDKNTSYYNRVKALLPELDSVIKQFDLYQQYGKVDMDLFEMNSKGSSYRRLGSLIDNKFLYFKSNEIIAICSLIFDTQSQIACINKYKQYESFFINSRLGLYMKDFEEYQQKIIQKNLINTDFMGIDITGKLYFKQEFKIIIYKQIWEIGYITLIDINCSDENNEMINDEITHGNLRYGKSLFSEQESDYISYIMDNKKYSNSLDIRNKITHGNFSKKNPEEQKQYYLEVLMILLLYTYRINGELDHEYINKISKD